jgi:hypothetical protein
MTETSTAKIKLVVDNDSVCTVPYYKAQYRDSTIEALEKMLERAQQGEIDAICVGYVTSDGEIGGSGRMGSWLARCWDPWRCCSTGCLLPWRTKLTTSRTK